MTSDLKKILEARLSGSIRDIQPVGGGSINNAYRLQTEKGSFFCKVNNAVKFPQLFQKEAAGLRELASPDVIAVPQVIDCFEVAPHQFLLLQYIREGERTAAFWKTFGSRLAALHARSALSFGLPEDNYMGSVPQSNRASASWSFFFQTQRLEPLVKLCFDKGLLTSRHLQHFEKFYTRLHLVFNEEPPSLLHGDLWSGNFLCTAAGDPVLIDPAVYYGHRAVDLGMSTLFGGFHKSFYEAYQYHAPLPGNYKEQWEAANLYPLLIHLYLFGSSYRIRIEKSLQQFG